MEIRDSLALDTEIANLLVALDDKVGNAVIRNWIDLNAFGQLNALLVESGEHSAPMALAGEETGEATAARRVYARALRDVPRGFTASYKTSTEELFEKLLKQGSNAAAKICEAYCDNKNKIDVGNDAALLILIAKGMIWDLGTGIPINSLIALLLKSGALDRLCEC